jgi:hypothetical protein
VAAISEAAPIGDFAVAVAEARLSLSSSIAPASQVTELAAGDPVRERDDTPTSVVNLADSHSR